MENWIQAIEDFFNRYEDNFNNSLQNDTPDPALVAEAFSECFIAAGPQGVMCGNRDETFIKQIPEGYAYYKKIGITGMNIIAKDTTILDENHAMTRVHWEAHYIKAEQRGDIDFEVIYLLQWLDGGPKIFGYITGDEQKALHEHGLV